MIYLVLFLFAFCPFHTHAPSGVKVKETVLKHQSYEDYSWKNNHDELKIAADDKGLEIDYLITPEAVEGMPYRNPQGLEVKISDEFKKDWRVIEVTSDVIYGDGRQQKTLNRPSFIPENEDGLIHMRDMASDVNYILTLRLHRSSECGEPESFKKNIDKNISLKLFYKK